MSTDWAAEGLLHGLVGRDRDARVALLDTLVAEGFSLEDIRRSHRSGEIMFLMAGRSLQISARHTWHELLELSGLEEALVVRLLRSQGITWADDGEAWYTDADLALLQTTSGFLAAGVDVEDVLTISRLLGKGFSQAAEAMRSVTLQMVLEPGLDERELAVRYAATADALTPMMEPMLGNLLRLHLAKLVQTELISAEERHAGRLPGARHVAVAFGDLVGFTRLGEELPPGELGAVAGRLEEMVLDLVAGPVRFIKAIGDAVMLVSPEPEPLVTTMLALIEHAEQEGEDFPQLRGGIAVGDALSRAGDWFGRPVNLASRVTGIARPGSVLATEDVRADLPDAFDWSRAGLRHIKGIDGAVGLWRVRPRAPDVT